MFAATEARLAGDAIGVGRIRAPRAQTWV